MKPLLPILVAALLAGCVAQTTVETRSVQDAQATDARRRAEIHTSLASQYYQRGNFVVALDETRLALKDDSTYYPAFNVRALVFMELREDAQARTAFEQALALAPNDPDILNNYGWFLCLRGEGARGMDYFSARAGRHRCTPRRRRRCSTRACARASPAATSRPRTTCAAPSCSSPTSPARSTASPRSSTRRAAYKECGELPRALHAPGRADPLGARARREDRARAGRQAAEDSMSQQLRRRFPDAPQTREILIQSAAAK